ncbi:DUF2442 domain-containing protein [Halochromatium glycolicum]|uniref:DUF2442 domain-containing protein n=1 Tax=Halochromatium glycolicum TaxID=85075 RepID=A0AAJ0XC13_9GAMM|nr:hypothetical protein [Halochromatium glycolicum]
MKLIRFKHIARFEFSLTFENGKTANVDLEPLVGNHLSAEQLGSAEIDPEWGCLQFAGGSVDIEPKTLYRFAFNESGIRAA